jgi:DNA-binding FrmR family transcriptional regulator
VAAEHPTSANMRPVFWEEADLLRRLRRIEGQVRGIQAMVARRDGCRAILTQVAAVEGALAQVSRIVGACSVAEELADIGTLPETTVVKERLKQMLRRL